MSHDIESIDEIENHVTCDKGTVLLSHDIESIDEIENQTSSTCPGCDGIGFNFGG